ncbi:MAG TPA: RNA-binding transcriptional accessory protein [Erysipelotrichaceae bacterium]|nr:RNA-binding transcriptional accessory protein [Erysipelotrichaceae bacterium]
MEKLIAPIAKSLNISYAQVKNTLDLLADGNTIPFIARYRKEVTKDLDEEQIRFIDEHYQYQKNLAKRKEDVKRLIETQGKLTDALVEQIDACETLALVEDIYRPYQQKRKTRATDAIAKGLQGLADWILSLPRNGSIETEAKKYLNDQVTSIEEAIQGAKDIIAEKVSDDAKLRKLIRDMMVSEAKIMIKLKKNAVDEQKTYRVYYDYNERCSTLAPHRIMAINRGEREKILDVSMDYNRERFARYQFNQMTHHQECFVNPLIDEAIRDGLKRLVYPSLERELRASLTDMAQEKSIDVFSANLESLLLQAPMKDAMILGLDPAYRTGCKLAIIDQTGKLLHIDLIYPHPPVNKIKEARAKTIELLKKYKINLIAIGNGTASRESEMFIAEILKSESDIDARYAIVSEAGASVYSAGDLAREEFPDLHVEERSAVSIARRLLDPLSELIKIDPKSIGVGQYQHDLAPARLQERLDFAVVKTVNRIGADVNTASEALLKHIAGLNKNVAKSLVEYRNENGLFKSRKELAKIKGLGAKAYTQAAGFLRIPKAVDELDATAIHPESYALTRSIMKELGIKSLQDENKLALVGADAQNLANRLNSDVYTVQDILQVLANPFRDYRDRFDGPLLHKDIVKIEDLKLGMRLEGTVRNVTDFGAFVDIGLKNDGLVHISKLSKVRIKSPYERVAVGDIVSVTVIDIDLERNKVALSMLESV